MTKNKNYYFLFTHTTKSKIYIRRIEITKNLLYSSLAFSSLFLGAVSFSIVRLTETDVLAKLKEPASLVTTEIVQQQISIPNNKPITPDYSRPSNAESFTFNSGGPDFDLQLTEEEVKEAESSNVLDQLRAIQAKSDPAFLPTIWSLSGKINNEFGFRRNPFGGRTYEFHAGMDIDGEKGDPIVAPGNGVVTKAGWQGGYGYMIEIDHGYGLTTRYGHLSKIEVDPGSSVQRGQIIGLVGSTGRSTGPHLHYELRLNDKPINPRLFLPPEPTEIK